MATRNLTGDFTSERERTRRRSSHESPGLGNGKASLLQDVDLSSSSSSAPVTVSEVELGVLGGDGERGGGHVKNMLPPAWVDDVEAVERDISAIDSKIEELQELHKQRLMVKFDDTNEDQQDSHIERAATAITAIFRRAEKKLKTISADTDFSGPQRTKGSVPEHKLRANIVRTLASRLQQCSVTFRRAQKEFLARRAEQKKSASGGGGSTSFDFLDEKPKGNDLIKVDSPGGAGGFTLEQIEVVENMEDEIATRDHEINTLVSSIEELSQIFKELAVLVIDQGTILDRIDYNMEQVVEKVEDGVVELERAEELQKSARPRWCICILLTLISVFLTFLILKHTDTDDNDKKKNDDDDDRRRRRYLYDGPWGGPFSLLEPGAHGGAILSPPVQGLALDGAAPPPRLTPASDFYGSPPSPRKQPPSLLGSSSGPELTLEPRRPGRLQNPRPASPTPPLASSTVVGSVTYQQHREQAPRKAHLAPFGELHSYWGRFMQRSSWSPFATVDHQLVGGSSLFRGQRHGGEKEQQRDEKGIVTKHEPRRHGGRSPWSIRSHALGAGAGSFKNSVLLRGSLDGARAAVATGNSPGNQGTAPKNER